MVNVLSISTLTPKVSAWPSTFHTGRMNAAGKPPNGLVVRFVNFEPLEPGSIPGGEACQGASACPPGKCTGYLGGIYGTPPPPTWD